MPAIVEFPQVIQQALKQFGHLFACEPQRRHFAEYLNFLRLHLVVPHIYFTGKFFEPGPKVFHAEARS
jgi:hypothetical protein